jgi:hypothetical protein
MKPITHSQASNLIRFWQPKPVAQAFGHPVEDEETAHTP